MHKILALDPGGTTGYAIGYLDGNMLAVDVNEEVFTPYQLYQFVRVRLPGYVVYEDFEYRNRAPAGLSLMSPKLIGVIELLSDVLPSTKFYSQHAGQVGVGGKGGLFNNAYLKELGVYKVGCEHGRDATRHLFYWLTEKAGTQLYEGTKLVARML